MKHKKLLYTMIPVLGLAGILGIGGLGLNSASAHGLGGFGFGFGGISALTPDQIAAQQKTAFEKQAQILGISVDDLKEAWADGKSIQQIIQEKGLNQTDIQNRAKAARMDQMKTQLQTLVTQGVITQSQADRRLAATQTMIQNGGNGHSMRGGMRMGGGLF